MIIKEANEKEKIESLLIADELTDWFTQAGLKHMRTDFLLNNVVVAKEEDEVVGFICYTSRCGVMNLIWLAVKKDKHGKGIGNELLKWIEEETKRLNLHSIELETLTDEDKYDPYQKTRDFYYKNGFEKIGYKKARIKGWDDQVILEKKIN